MGSIDAGKYRAVYTDPAMAGRGSQTLNLSVGPGDRLLNLSTRANLAAGAGQNVLAGFVVAGRGPKRIILRADVTLMMPFTPGNYVAEVTSRDGAGGTVLLEIYEVP